MDVDQVEKTLRLVEAGDQTAREELFQHLYVQLTEQASRLMKGEMANVTLQTTALVHECYIRMVQGKAALSANDRSHFLAIAARAMKQILVDHARKRQASKRGGDAQKLGLDLMLDQLEQESQFDLIQFNDLLEQYGEFEPRGAEVVQLKLFAGSTVDEIASQLQVSRSTVEHEWRVARAWLHSKLGHANE